jgi:drug/metabolite transporter (DMT)-like permease
VGWLALLALLCFAANSVLARVALRAGQIDAASFTAIRLAAGALFLSLLLRRAPPLSARTALGALLLFLYAAPFSFAYLGLSAGTGALLLFGAVQATMIGTGLVQGERPGAGNWVGLALAVGGLVLLTLPGVTAPAPTGAVLMVAAGVCWGAYTLVGRRSRDPLAATAGNFWRASILTLVVLTWFVRPDRVTSAGVVLAVVCGALASGVGYTIWYAALPGLSRWSASLVQLTAPVLTALAATVLLDETITLRLAGATVFVAAGVWLSLRR